MSNVNFVLFCVWSEVPPQGTTAVPLDLRGAFVVRPTKSPGGATDFATMNT